MLHMLEVRNLALIDNLSFYPGAGLNVISGETGAGKSMLVGALELLLGTRAGTESIRSGEEAALVQAVFDDASSELLLCREIRRYGPNICRINGRVETLAALAAAGRRLVDLHGQNQQQSLLSTETQRKLLDAYGGPEILALAAEVAASWQESSRLQKLLQGLGGDDAAAERKADFLRYQLAEINEAALSAAEEEQLERLFKKLSHSRQLAERTAWLYAELYEGAHDAAIIDRLGRVEKELAAAAALDVELATLLDQVSAAAMQLKEASRRLHDYHEGLDHDQGELHRVAERLEVYRKIKKKYGPHLADVEKTAKQLEEELSLLVGRREQAARLAREREEMDRQLLRLAASLSQKRRVAAAGLAEKISGAMQDLALPGARFAVHVESLAQPGPHGCDRVEFLFSANPGEPLLPLSKTASGGETARVMLAVKSVLAAEDSVPTLVFDEIDAGIGGVTVRTVAARLKSLAAHRQVICVTHQPIIAAVAHHHFLIYKETENSRTVTRLRKLEGRERENELARMLGGGEHALEHARELLREN